MDLGAYGVCADCGEEIEPIYGPDGTLLRQATFKALGDPTRLYLVARLCREGPLPIVRRRGPVVRHASRQEGADQPRRVIALLGLPAGPRLAEARMTTDVPQIYLPPSCSCQRTQKSATRPKIEVKPDQRR